LVNRSKPVFEAGIKFSRRLYARRTEVVEFFIELDSLMIMISSLRG